VARYPGGQWRPLASNWAAQPKLTKFDLVILHTMVGSLNGTDGYFRGDGYGGAESHFGVGHDGTVYQWQDTNHRAEANGAANARAISIETADMGTGFAKWNTNDGNAVPAWTDAQREAIARIVAWSCTTHDIPCSLIPDSKATRRGIGFHRQGVPGYAVAGGELWSSARGKVCPGPKRIAQIPGIITRANALLGTPHSVVTPSAGGDNNVLENYRLDGGGNFRLIFPVGKASGVLARGWISAAVDGPSAGSVHIFFQNDSGGISDVRWDLAHRDGHSARPWSVIPDGTTMININHNFPDGGVIAVEGLGK